MSGWITFQSAKLARVDQFSVGVDTHIYLGVLEHDDAIELYQLWENNFWLYCQMNTFSTALSCT